MSLFKTQNHFPHLNTVLAKMVLIVVLSRLPNIASTSFCCFWRWGQKRPCQVTADHVFLLVEWSSRYEKCLVVSHVLWTADSPPSFCCFWRWGRKRPCQESGLITFYSSWGWGASQSLVRQCAWYKKVGSNYITREQPQFHGRVQTSNQCDSGP